MAGIGHNRSRSQSRQQVLDDLFILAFTAERQAVQVSACVAWLNLVEGTLVARGAYVSPENEKKLAAAAAKAVLALIKTNKK